MRTIGLVIVVAFALILSSCDSGEPTPGLNGGRVDLTILASGNDAFSLASGRVAHGKPHMFSDSIMFTQALLGVTKVELEKLDSADTLDHHGDCDDVDHGNGHDRINHGGHGDKHHDGDDDDVEIEGEFIVDLIAGTSTPEMGFDSLGAGSFKEIEITVAPVLPDSNSIFLAFEVMKDSNTLMVEFSSDRTFDLKIKKHHGFEIGDNSLDQVLVLLHLETLLGKIDFSRAKADEDGVIRINEKSNWNFFNLVRSRFHLAFEVGKDRDHDGDIDE